MMPEEEKSTDVKASDEAEALNVVPAGLLVVLMRTEMDEVNTCPTKFNIPGETPSVAVPTTVVKAVELPILLNA